ncbi:MAG: hypothetical protein IT285_11040 [Bdellovibrionales bacterium]|nr:hypothetical protein [Bdellovibrionales bacterium]
MYVALGTITSSVTYGATRQAYLKDAGGKNAGWGALSISGIVVGAFTMIGTGGGCVFKTSSESELEFGPNEYRASNQTYLWGSLINSGLNVWMWSDTKSVGARWVSGVATFVPAIAAFFYRDHFRTDRTVRAKELKIETSAVPDGRGGLAGLLALRYEF